MKTRILLYGIQRSGTNYIETILKKNFKVKFLNSNKDRSAIIQKHCRIYDNKLIIPEPQYHNNIFVNNFQEFESHFNKAPDFYIVISKDPYSWYLSYLKWAKKCNWPEVNHHYIEEYNLFYEKFLNMANESDKFIFIRYIDLLQDKDSVLNMLSNKMKLQKKWASRFMNQKTTKVSQSKPFSNEKLNYYLEAEYLKEYTSGELDNINKHIDNNVVESLGYSIYKK